MRVNYEVLEVKEGRIIALKYDSEELKLHTPNTVVAFTNNRPRVDQLAQERWRIFKIKGDDLVDVTNVVSVYVINIHTIYNKCY